MRLAVAWGWLFPGGQLGLPLILVGLALVGPLWAAAPAASGANAAAAPRLIRTEPPRDSARHLGDLVTYRALIDWPEGWEIDRDGLAVPGAAREDAPLELRGHRLRRDREACSQCRWLELDWQIFRSPRAAEDLRLPAIALRLRQGDRVENVTLPPAVLAIFPLVPWDSRRDWLHSIRPGWQASFYRTDRHAIEVAAALLGAVLALAGWAWASGRWVPRRSRRPFAQALQALRRRRDGPPQGLADEEDLRHWHRAVDATAGRAVFGADLDAFFAEHPALAACAERSRRVFQASQRLHFFDGAGAASALPRTELLATLRGLERAEFGQARSAARKAGPGRGAAR